MARTCQGRPVPRLRSELPACLVPVALCVRIRDPWRSTLKLYNHRASMTRSGGICILFVHIYQRLANDTHSGQRPSRVMMTSYIAGVRHLEKW